MSSLFMAMSVGLGSDRKTVEDMDSFGSMADCAMRAMYRSNYMVAPCRQVCALVISAIIRHASIPITFLSEPIKKIWQTLSVREEWICLD
jgi:hypothetical protein